MTKNILKLSSLLLLFIGLTFTSCQKEELEKRETFAPSYGEAYSETPKVRRCRVVKRYRPKGEVYRMNVAIDNSLLAFIDLDSDNDGISDLIENKKNPKGFGGYIAFEFLDLNGKPLSCTGPIKLTATKSQGNNGKDIEFESEEIEAKNGNGICGTTDHFLYPVNINFYNSKGKLVFTQNTTFNLESNFDGKGKKEQIFESSEILDGPYKVAVQETQFDVTILSVGSAQNKVVQVLMSFLNITEKEAYTFIVNTPYTFTLIASEKEVIQLRNALEEVGTKIEYTVRKEKQDGQIVRLAK